MMVIPACEFKACLDSDRTITSRTSINLAKILIYKILPNTTYNFLELLFYNDTWASQTRLSSRIPDFLLSSIAPIPATFPKPKPSKAWHWNSNRGHAPKSSVALALPSGKGALRPWGYLLRKPFLLKQSGCFLGGGRNSTHTVQLKAMFFVFGPFSLFKKLQWMGWRASFGDRKLHSDFLD